MRSPSGRPNVNILLTGIAVLVLGVLLVLDANGAIDLRFAYMAPVLVGALGAILLTGGLVSRGRGRRWDHDSDQDHGRDQANDSDQDHGRDRG